MQGDFVPGKGELEWLPGRWMAGVVDAVFWWGKGKRGEGWSLWGEDQALGGA